MIDVRNEGTELEWDFDTEGSHHKPRNQFDEVLSFTFTLVNLRVIFLEFAGFLYWNKWEDCRLAMR